MIIDSHSHIYFKNFDEDRDDVILRAINAGVHKIILPNIDTQSIEPMLKLASAFPETCFPLIGLHPTYVKENYREELKTMTRWLGKRDFFGIGETGIDLYWDKSFLKEQIFAFRTQLELANEYKLPVVIHMRDSFDEVMNTLNEEKCQNLKGVFHSFSGSLRQAEKIVEKGFKIGVNGIITFKNSGVGEVIRQIPLQNILIETDAPFLAPVPHRGSRNESAHAKLIAMKIAELYETSFEKVAQQTSKNTEDIFDI